MAGLVVLTCQDADLPDLLSLPIGLDASTLEQPCVLGQALFGNGWVQGMPSRVPSSRIIALVDFWVGTRGCKASYIHGMNGFKSVPAYSTVGMSKRWLYVLLRGLAGERTGVACPARVSQPLVLMSQWLHNLGLPCIKHQKTKRKTKTSQKRDTVHIYLVLIGEVPRWPSIWRYSTHCAPADACILQ